MSWSATYDSKQAFDADEPSSSTPIEALDESAREQRAIAREVAAKVIASGAVGDATRDFSVGLYGHANPGHAPATGWANDCLTVTVTQKAAS